MKKLLTLLFSFFLLGTCFGQIEFNPDTTIRPSKANVYRLAVNGGAIRIVPKTGNVILLASGTITSVNGKTTPSVTLLTSDITEGSNLYYTAGRVQSVGDARYPQLSLVYNNPSWLNSLDFSKVSNKPTTVSGYGITDALTSSSTYANPSFITSLVWSKITGTPTTIAAYGITDGVSTATTYTNPAWLTALAWSKITSTPTTLAGYNISDAAPSSTTIPYQTMSTYASAVALSVSGMKLLIVTSDEQYGESNSLYIKIGSVLSKIVRNVE